MTLPRIGTYEIGHSGHAESERFEAGRLTPVQNKRTPQLPDIERSGKRPDCLEVKTVNEPSLAKRFTEVDSSAAQANTCSHFADHREVADPASTKCDRCVELLLDDHVTHRDEPKTEEQTSQTPSRYKVMPAALGWVLMVGGVTYMIDTYVAQLVADAPAAVSSVLVGVATLGELWMIGYLLIFGVRTADRIPPAGSPEAAASGG